MTQFKKWMSLVLAAVMCIGLLAACGGGDGNKAPDTTQPPDTTASDETPSTAPDANAPAEPAEPAAGGYSAVSYTHLRAHET